MSRRCVLALIPILLLVAGGARAASLLVTPSAAFSGGFGLRVTPGSGCAAEAVVELPDGGNPGPTITGTHEACARLAAQSIEAVGTTTFSAGDEVLLRDGFAAGGTFTAVVGALDSPLAYVVTNCQTGPCANTSYMAQFYVDADALTLSASDRVEIFNGYSADLVAEFKVILKWNAGMGELRLYLEAYEDGSLIGSTENSDEIVLDPGWNKIEIDWSASASGNLTAEVNDVPHTGLTGLANPTSSVSVVRWGVVGGTLDGVSGHLDVDEFASWN